MLSSELEFCLNEAFQRARDRRLEFMTDEHLLLALLDIPKVHEILKACNANIPELRRQLVECIDEQDPGRTFALNLDGNDPNEVAPVVARRVHEEGYRLFALHPEQRDIETVFAQVAADGSADGDTAHV